MTDQLLEIPRHEWTNLRDLYKQNWPRHHVGFYTVDNFIRWIAKDPNIKNLHVYCLNGDWSDGTFLIVDRYQLFLNSLNESNERLKIGLSLLNWNHGYKISSFLDRHRPAVLDIITTKNLQKEYDSATVLYYLPQAEATNFDIKPTNGIVLKPMTEEDAIIAESIWPNRHQGSIFFLKRLANWNPNIGAFTADGELVAWCFRLQAGPLGALQVKESHMRQGLGSLVTRAMIQILADMGHDTFALVTESNLPSRKMFEGLGFQNIDTCHWLRTYPLVPFNWTDD